MSFYLRKCGEESRDCTAPYKVVLDESCTVGTFIEEVLKRDDEWGYIGIKDGRSIFGNPACEYRYGKLKTEMRDCVVDKKIISATASGGWSRMDYLLEIER